MANSATVAALDLRECHQTLAIIAKCAILSTGTRWKVRHDDEH